MKYNRIILATCIALASLFICGWIAYKYDYRYAEHQAYEVVKLKVMGGMEYNYKTTIFGTEYIAGNIGDYYYEWEFTSSGTALDMVRAYKNNHDCGIEGVTANICPGNIIRVTIHGSLIK